MIIVGSNLLENFHYLRLVICAGTHAVIKTMEMRCHLQIIAYHHWSGNWSSHWPSSHAITDRYSRGATIKE